MCTSPITATRPAKLWPLKLFSFISAQRFHHLQLGCVIENSVKQWCIRFIAFEEFYPLIMFTTGIHHDNNYFEMNNFMCCVSNASCRHACTILSSQSIVRFPIQMRRHTTFGKDILQCWPFSCAGIDAQKHVPSSVGQLVETNKILWQKMAMSRRAAFSYHHNKNLHTNKKHNWNCFAHTCRILSKVFSSKDFDVNSHGVPTGNGMLSMQHFTRKLYWPFWCFLSPFSPRNMHCARATSAELFSHARDNFPCSTTLKLDHLFNADLNIDCLHTLVPFWWFAWKTAEKNVTKR